ncbi:MAG: hypothetical protein ACLS3C_08965 [Oscillospiraceae bacterium]
MIDGVDFSEFLDNAPASRKTAAAPIPDPQPIREPVKTPEANKPPAPEKSAVTEDVPAPDTAAAQPAARRVGIVSILLRIFAFAAALATAGFLTRRRCRTGRAARPLTLSAVPFCNRSI